MNQNIGKELDVLTKISMNSKLSSEIKQNITTNGGNFHPTRPNSGEIGEWIPKYYINNPSSLIKTAVGSGGVEAAAPSKQSSHTVRLSISPSQGDDPGFKSRPEHF